MNKILRLTESELVGLIIKMINEERFDNLQDYVMELQTMIDEMESFDPGSDELNDILGQIKQLARMAEFDEDLTKDEKDEFFVMVDDILKNNL